MLKIFKSGVDTDSEEIRALKADLNKKHQDAEAMLSDLKHKLSIAERTFTVVKQFELSDVNYLGKIAEIAKSEEFRFHIYNARTFIVNKISESNKDDVVTLQGMLKGLDFFIESTMTSAIEYAKMAYSMEAEQNAKV